MGVIDVFPEAREPSVAENGVGVHVLLDLYAVAQERVTDGERLRRTLIEAAETAGLTCLSDPVVYRFPNGGLTGFVPLAESHIAFHTYPERGFVAADVFTCGSEETAIRAADVFCAALAPGRTGRRVQRRGESAR
ncbi:MAG: adenosylmethionine decarboxylase [Capsulimonadales bacterium]|nr:adenosylmethionine decarboxylase [Capsulimonadales bacterium]